MYGGDTEITGLSIESIWRYGLGPPNVLSAKALPVRVDLTYAVPLKALVLISHCPASCLAAHTPRCPNPDNPRAVRTQPPPHVGPHIRDPFCLIQG